MNTVSKPEIREYEMIRERLVRRTALFGLLRWYEVEKKDSIGKNLVILIHRIPDKIFLNGEEYIKKI